MSIYLPQGGDLLNWVNTIAGGDIGKAEKIQEHYAHLIGNLTMTAYNSQLSDDSFINKRDRTNENGSPIGYRNGLVLNEDLKNENSWGVEQIEDRTKKLVDEAINLFRFE